MKLLTIVIPSYNTEKFIDKNMAYYIDERLFKSVQILLIDDGSKDSTKEKAMRYQNEYPEYVKVISKSNGGHGSVINCGIRNAKGKYFKVIDADDWVETKNLVKFVEYLKDKDVDLIVNPYNTIHEVTKRKQKVVNFKNVEYDVEYQFDQIAGKYFKFLSLHGITIRTEILIQNGIRLTEDCFYEDFEYVLFPIPYVNRVVFFELPIYNYLIGQSSQSVSDENVLRNKDMLIKVYAESVRYFEEVSSKMCMEKKNYIENNILKFGNSIYNVFLRNYKKNDAYNWMHIYDCKIKEISRYYYDEIGKKYPYIRLCRKKSKVYFILIAKILWLYKRVV